MSIKDICGCPPTRQLGTPHIPPCQLAEQLANDKAGPSPQANVLVLRNPETQRPVAIPDEIISVAERDYRAYKANRLEGKTWEQIAVEEQYESAGAARAAVQRYLEEAVAVLADFTREQMIADHIGRLDYYRSKLLPGIELGKTASVMTALAVEDRWVAALGLDQVQAEDAMQQTVVVASPEYLQMLQQADQDAQNEGGEAATG